MTDGISPIKIMIVHDNKNTTNPTMMLFLPNQPSQQIGSS